MKNSIKNVFVTNKPEMLNRVENSLRRRIQHCIERGGRHFENELNLSLVFLFKYFPTQ